LEAELERMLNIVLASIGAGVIRTGLNALPSCKQVLEIATDGSCKVYPTSEYKPADGGTFGVVEA
jgi:hypothetical protein